ncbi:restriction endonuclease subunit S [Sorangium sp. KYC3313]|uniref:restriction endonuclease subunit S n=1 Tax=Sorangium sp. KYC3313 TaxID=3449740 RepID=UPI003F8987DA
MMPEAWSSSTLEQIATSDAGLQTGPFGSQLHASDYTTEGIPVVMPKDLANGRVVIDTIARIPDSLADNLSRHRVLPGDILFGRRGDIGRCGLVTENEQRWLCGTGCLRVRLDTTQAHPSFLIHALMSPPSVQWLTDHAVGQTMLNLNTGILAKLPLLLPPLGEQRKIAAILSAVDDAIEATQAVIDQLRVVKKAMMAELLTRGLPGRHTRFKKTEFGELPEEWNDISLDECIEEGRPICYGILMPGKGHPGGVPVIKVKDIKNGMIDEGDILLTSPELDKQYRRSRLREGDILITIRGTTGRVARVPAALHQANITQDTARLSIRQDICRDFLFYALQGPALQRQIQDHTRGQAVKGINIGDVRRLRIALPGRQEQDAIAQMFNNTVDCEMANYAELTALKQTKSALRSALLTGEIRVTTDEAAP